MPRNVWSMALFIALSATPQIAAQEAGHYGALVDANARFAFKFFRQSLAKTPDNNVLTAPIALSRDFAFLQNGADAEAREEILRAFELGNLSSDEINQQSLALHKALSYPQPHPPTPPSRRPPNEEAPPPPICCEAPPERLILAGSLWAQPNVAFRTTFLERSKKFYSFQTVSVPNRGLGSYSPDRTCRYAQSEGRRLEIELRSLFRRFERNENVAARYRTVALIGRPSSSRSKQTTAVRQIPD